MQSKWVKKVASRITRGNRAEPSQEEISLCGDRFDQIQQLATKLQTERDKQDEKEFAVEWKRLSQVCKGDISSPHLQKQAGAACAELMEMIFHLENIKQTERIPEPFDIQIAQRSCQYGMFQHCVTYDDLSGSNTATLEKANEFSRRCQKDGDGEACWTYLEFLFAPPIRFPDQTLEKLSPKFLKKGCRAGHVGSCSVLSITKPDTETYLLVEDCCDKGNPDCCQLMFDKSIRERRFADAYEFATLSLPACHPGPICPYSVCGFALAGLAKSNLGPRFVNKKVDQTKAFQIFDDACNKCEDGEACAVAGSMIERGWGRPKDRSQAQTYYSKACSLKFFTGCYLAHNLSVDGKTHDLFSLERE